jgi:predicted DNA binding protein
MSWHRVLVKENPMNEMTDAEAVRIAQEACNRRSIQWREPRSVKQGWRWWTVMTPSNLRGGNAIISISRTTGQVKVRFYTR